MLTEIPAVDWLTLTTDSLNDFVSARLRWQEDRERYYRLLNGKRKRGNAAVFAMPVKKGKIMQYEGQYIDGVFWGVGKQNGADHYYVRASGDISNQLALQGGALSAFGATRVDVQFTVPYYREFVDLELLAMLRDGAYWGDRKVPTVDAHIEHSGLSTVYVGSRSSMKFLRVYVKPGEGFERYVRYELELKQDMANNLWRDVNSGRAVLAGVCGGVLRDSISRLPPEVVDSQLKPLYDGLMEFDPVRLVVGRYAKSENSTLNWLYDSVLPAVKKLSSDHEQYAAVVQWLEAVKEVVGENG